MKKVWLYLLLAFAALNAHASLDFNSAGSARRVTVAAATAINGLASGGTFSGWAWIYRQANGTNQFIVSNSTNASRAAFAAWEFQVDDLELTLAVRLSGAVAQYTSSGGVAVPLDTWTFVAFSYDSGATPKIHLYYGRLDAVLVEPSYSASAAGSGTIGTDNAGLIIGNVSDAFNTPFRGKIETVGLSNLALSIGQLDYLRYSTMGQAVARADTKFLLRLAGTGTQSDLTANGNNGTVTSAVDGGVAPLPGSNLWWLVGTPVELLFL